MATLVLCAGALLASCSALRVPESRHAGYMADSPNPEEPANITNLADRLRRSPRDRANGTNLTDPACARCPAVSMLSRGTLGVPFGNCALVGSSEQLVGLRLGALIDEDYDTVIRVNRLPSPAYREDFGARTDVLFAGAVADRMEMFSRQGQRYRTLGNETGFCSYDGVVCPFKSLILKGADTLEVNSTFQQLYPASNPGWRPSRSRFAVARQSQDLNTLAYRLLGWVGQKRRKRPTNGFQAFLTAAVACETLDVFGFAGNGTADGHKVITLHNLSREHLLMHRFAAGGLQGDFESFLPRCAPCLGRRSRSARIVEP